MLSRVRMICRHKLFPVANSVLKGKMQELVPRKGFCSQASRLRKKNLFAATTTSRIEYTNTCSTQSHHHHQQEQQLHPVYRHSVYNISGREEEVSNKHTETEP